MLNFTKQSELLEWIANNSKHYTPTDIIDIISYQVKGIDFSQKRVVETSVGEGNLLIQLAYNNPTLLEAKIDVYDIEQENLDITKKSLEKVGFKDVSYYLGDFMLRDFEDEIIYDYAFQNPPYGTKINVEVNDKWKDILNVKKNKFKNPEMAFLYKTNRIARHSFSILPIGITFRQGWKELRQKLLPSIENITVFPDNIFTTTSISTLLIELNRDNDKDHFNIIPTDQFFQKDGKLNKLIEKDLDKVLNNKIKITHQISEENNHNWNPVRYIEVEMEDFDLQEAFDDLDNTIYDLIEAAKEVKDLRKDLFKLLDVEDV